MTTIKDAESYLAAYGYKLRYNTTIEGNAYWDVLRHDGTIARGCRCIPSAGVLTTIMSLNAGEVL